MTRLDWYRKFALTAAVIGASLATVACEGFEGVKVEGIRPTVAPTTPPAVVDTPTVIPTATAVVPPDAPPGPVTLPGTSQGANGPARLDEDFDDLVAQDWYFYQSAGTPASAAWSFRDLGGNGHLAGSGHVYADYQLGASWTDYRFEVVTEIGDTNVHMSVRSGPDGRYFVSLFPSGVAVYKERWSGGTSQELGVANVAVTRNDPHVVAITVTGEHISVSVDGVPRFDYIDDDQPLLVGTVGLEVVTDGLSVALFDRVSVRPINIGSAATVEPTATPEPAVTPTTLPTSPPPTATPESTPVPDGGTLFVGDEVGFRNAIELIGPGVVVDFEELPGQIPLTDQFPLAGDEWSTLGVTFTAGDGLRTCGADFWHASVSLSPGICPYATPGDNADSLIVHFDPPVYAAGVQVVDNVKESGESVAFLDADGNVIRFYEELPQGEVALISEDRLISEIRIVEHDGDDASAYDNVIFVNELAPPPSPTPVPTTDTLDEPAAPTPTPTPASGPPLATITPPTATPVP